MTRIIPSLGHDLRAIAAMAICAIAFLGLKTWAMSPVEDDSTRSSIGRTGELFTIQYTPGSRSLTVGFAGKPALTLDSSRITILGKSYPLKGEPKALKIVPTESRFEIVDELPPNEALEFEIKDKKSKKAEKFKIENRQP